MEIGKEMYYNVSIGCDFMKKKSLIILISVIAVVAVIAFACIGSYNGLVEDREEVVGAEAEISVVLQRRADLIPNLLNTVKGYTEYEQSTLTAVTEARNAVKNADSVGEEIDASARLDSALNVWVNAVTEAYPELKANEQFTTLSDELSGSENRVAQARRDYNEKAREYNTEIKKFPKSIFAGLFGFESFEYFENDESANQVPEVSFD